MSGWDWPWLLLAFAALTVVAFMRGYVGAIRQHWPEIRADVRELRAHRHAGGKLAPLEFGQFRTGLSGTHWEAACYCGEASGACATSDGANEWMGDHMEQHRKGVVKDA